MNVKAEKLRMQIEHLKIKFSYEMKLRQAKYELDMKKLELALADAESR
jgi:hypothetical protein